MRLSLLFFGAACVSSANTFAPKTIYDADGLGAQTNRPISYGWVFRQGDIPSGKCPQPAVGGTVQGNGTVSGASLASPYQADIKNFWPDGSVKFAIISFYRTVSNNGSILVSIGATAGTCPAGGLSLADMDNFDSSGSGWGASMEFTAGGTTITRNARSMLDDNDPALGADGRNLYWLKGPIVTQVIVRDNTSNSKWSLGWTWNGATMTSPVDCTVSCGNKASINPMYILTFYPGSNYADNTCSGSDPYCGVKIDYLIENTWIQRGQNQLYSLTLKSGNPPATVYSHSNARQTTDAVLSSSSLTVTSSTANFTASDVGTPVVFTGTVSDSSVIQSVTNSTTAVLTSKPNASGTNVVMNIGMQIAFTRWRKTFWSGTPPGHVRVDHNFSYLISTGAIANYDQSVSISPDSTVTCSSSSDYACFAAGDKGGLGGAGLSAAWSKSYASNNEGALLQREDLTYLYNMGSCGTANSACAKGVVYSDRRAWSSRHHHRGERGRHASCSIRRSGNVESGVERTVSSAGIAHYWKLLLPGVCGQRGYN